MFFATTQFSVLLYHICSTLRALYRRSIPASSSPSFRRDTSHTGHCRSPTPSLTGRSFPAVTHKNTHFCFVQKDGMSVATKPIRRREGTGNRSALMDLPAAATSGTPVRSHHRLPSFVSKHKHKFCCKVRDRLQVCSRDMRGRLVGHESERTPHSQWKVPS
jgi:hypothetical protein